ncbi:cutinase [Moniliophthora roreri]|nr:cutinase [Moniliophthora roreri]
MTRTTLTDEVPIPGYPHRKYYHPFDKLLLSYQQKLLLQAVRCLGHPRDNPEISIFSLFLSSTYKNHSGVNARHHVWRQKFGRIVNQLPTLAVTCCHYFRLMIFLCQWKWNGE